MGAAQKTPNGERVRPAVLGETRANRRGGGHARARLQARRYWHSPVRGMRWRGSRHPSILGLRPARSRRAHVAVKVRRRDRNLPLARSRHAVCRMRNGCQEARTGLEGDPADVEPLLIESIHEVAPAGRAEASRSSLSRSATNNAIMARELMPTLEPSVKSSGLAGWTIWRHATDVPSFAVSLWRPARHPE